jgi:imidazolonepropionase-like amidohydrolase
MASIAFRNARLIDSISDQPRDGMSIVVEGERISAVGSAEIPAPGNATVVDLKGQTVLPGLIDTHVHTTMMDQESLPLFLAAGVTSARDVGGKLEKVLQLRSDLNRGAQLGPRLFVLGPLLDGTDASLDGPFAEMLDSVPSVDAVPEKIGGLLKAGVDGIKIYFSMPPDTVRAVIKFVDKRVPITAHLGYTHSLDAIHAGIDGLEHVLISPFNEFCAVGMQFGLGASMLDPAFFPKLIKGWQEADLRAEGARNWIGTMVNKQVNMGTTLDLLWLAKFGVDAARRDADRKFIPPMAIRRQQQMAAHFGERTDWDIANPIVETPSGAAALEKHQMVTRTLHEAGGLVVGGTDCGGLSYPPPGFALLREVELLAEAIGSMAAIKAVTAVAARYMRQQDNLGTIAPGRFADMLIVDGDPVRDVRDLRKLKTVYRGGVAHDPQTLLAKVPQRVIDLAA